MSAYEDAAFESLAKALEEDMLDANGFDLDDTDDLDIEDDDEEYDFFGGSLFDDDDYDDSLWDTLENDNDDPDPLAEGSLTRFER